MWFRAKVVDFRVKGDSGDEAAQKNGPIKAAQNPAHSDTLMGRMLFS